MNVIDAILQAMKEDKGKGVRQEVRRDHLLKAQKLLAAAQPEK